MAVPKRRTTRGRRGMRRANHDRITPPNLVPCPKCSAPTLRHRACTQCGVYRDRQVNEVAVAEPESAES